MCAGKSDSGGRPHHCPPKFHRLEIVLEIVAVFLSFLHVTTYGGFQLFSFAVNARMLGGDAQSADESHLLPSAAAATAAAAAAASATVAATNLTRFGIISRLHRVLPDLVPWPDARKLYCEFMAASTAAPVAAAAAAAAAAAVDVGSVTNCYLFHVQQAQVTASQNFYHMTQIGRALTLQPPSTWSLSSPSSSSSSCSLRGLAKARHCMRAYMLLQTLREGLFRFPSLSLSLFHDGQLLGDDATTLECILADPQLRSALVLPASGA